jgi:ammonia channel protein AmtB
MVHVLGGTISLVAAWMIGPRIGRFPAWEYAQAKKEAIKDGLKSPPPPNGNGGGMLPKVVEIKGHSVPVYKMSSFCMIKVKNIKIYVK